MKRILLIVGLQLIAFWEVWQWYVSRAVYSWDQPWGLLAFVAAFAFLLVSRKPLPRRRAFTSCCRHCSSLFTPRLISSCRRSRERRSRLQPSQLTLSSLRFGRTFHPGLFGLFYLSLPALPTLQFFGGYPMRVVVAELTAPILRIGGFAVIPEGTCLNWAGQLIWIDAPCSGIKMLWVGMFLTFVLLCLYELPAT